MSREYLQYCGLARAMEAVGGRWTLLVVRDLLAGPKRFTELQKGLPGIPSNVLTSRLRELDDAGVVTRRLLGKGVAYELTPYGLALENAIVQLGMWGAQTMGPRTPEEHYSIHSLGLALRGAFQPAEVHDLELTFDLEVDDQRLQVTVSEGALSFPSAGETESTPDATLTAGPDVLPQIMSGRVIFEDAVRSGALRVEGSNDAARRFFTLFQLPAPAA
jgi:DNA-binding HxlR family transcriptional regulator